MNEYVTLVDEQDNPLELMGKMQAHQLGLLHRAFSVFVLQQRETDWYTLLQRRSLGKYHCAGLWTNTCCSHPQEHETIEQAAQRRLLEEMGFELPCVKVGHFIYRAELDNGLIEHEYDHVLLSIAPLDIQFRVNPQEVMDYQWCPLAQLDKYSLDQSTQFTPWFFEALAIIRQYLRVDAHE